MKKLLKTLLIATLFLSVYKHAFAAIDWGFNFRGSAGFVTDGPNETYVLGETTPTTRNGEGPFSWDICADCDRDRNNTVDRRLAGLYGKINNGTQATFTLTLPHPGTYIIHIALGDVGGQAYEYLKLYDNTTLLLTLDEPTGAFDQWYDATGVLYSATNWPTSEAGVTETFTSTSLKIVLGTPTAQSNTSTISHLRVVEVSTATQPPRLTLLQGMLRLLHGVLIIK